MKIFSMENPSDVARNVNLLRVIWQTERHRKYHSNEKNGPVKVHDEKNNDRKVKITFCPHVHPLKNSSTCTLTKISVLLLAGH